MSTSSHPNSRVITIFRASSILSRAQGPGVDDFFASSKQSIGSYFESESSQKVGNGLNMEEERLLMPAVIDMEPSDKEFRKKVSEFFADLTTQVPYALGVKLEIGLETDNEKPVSEKNMPISVMDYVRYRHALKHPWVAATKEQSEGDQTKQFYIFDKQAVQKKNTKRVKEVDAAMQIYLKIKNDENLVDQMLTVLGTNPADYAGKDKSDRKVEKLREYCENDATTFVETYNKEDLEVRYVLQTMINTKVLKNVGTRYIEVETEKLIGNNDEEAIWYFKDDENSQHVVTMKSRMQDALLTEPVKKTAVR